MDFQLPIKIPALPEPLTYRDNLLLIGSCFTEHIGNKLQELKFNVLQNPNGILFDPQSVAASLVSYIRPTQYTEADLFYLNELWQSWQHHSQFSDIDKNSCLERINHAQQTAHTFLQTANCIIITLGASFSYRLTDQFAAAHGTAAGKLGDPVANCHRAPAQWFTKHLMGIEETNAVLDNCIHQLLHFNPALKIIFTVSPVRHIRDGVIENNRSKARLIEVVHNLVNKFDRLFYFPAYELVIDVLRDYRFYDIDMVHPNYPATEFVLEKFTRFGIAEESWQVMEEVKKIVIAARHKAFQPQTNAHKQFLLLHLEKTKELQAKYPFLKLDREVAYFTSGLQY
ncbi:MAG: GSCFA domain-containing protein [Chitinophagaceae bacterium]